MKIINLPTERHNFVTNDLNYFNEYFDKLKSTIAHKSFNSFEFTIMVMFSIA